MFPSSRERAAMIPEFPQFKRLELSDRRDVEAMTAAYEPYSDFNFVSLWCWNTDGLCSVSRLNGNLVVQLRDYLTNEPLLSFLGTTATAETVDRLLDYAERHGIKPRLRLIPEIVVNGGDDFGATLSVEEDPGSADYVLSVDEWVGLHGGKFHDKRKALHKFERTQEPVFSHLDLRNYAVQRDIMRIFGSWIVKAERAGSDATVNEALAVRRFFTLQQNARLHGFGVEAAGVLRAFSLVETLDHGYLIGHFWKGDPDFPGIYVFLLNQMSRHFFDLGYRFFNIEQDLGNNGLAQSKRLYRPCHYLRKFEIARREECVPVLHARFDQTASIAQTY